MMETINTLPQEIKEVLGSKRLTFGRNTVIKALKKGDAERIVIASNTPKDLQETLEKYAEMSDTKIEMLKGNSKELGTRCKRAHNILMTALLKEKK